MNNGSNTAIKSQPDVQQSYDRLITDADHKPNTDRTKWLANNRLESASTRLFLNFNSLLITLYFIVFNTISKAFNYLIVFLSFHSSNKMSDEESGHSSNMSALVQQRQHHNKSYEIITRALKIDEQIADKNIGLS